MKIESDKQVDAAYIYLQDSLKDGDVKKSVELNLNMVLDYDIKAKLTGIEILNASKVLNKKVLLQS